MRLATLLEAHGPVPAVVREERLLPVTLDEPGFGSIREIAAGGADALGRLAAWAERQPTTAYRSLDDVRLAAAVPDPGAIYTVGLNYRAPEESANTRPERPYIYGKAASSVVGAGAVIAWDRALTDNVDAECELGIVIGAEATAVAPEEAMGHVFGYTCINDISSRDPWLDGDQWLLGKSMPGFCPVGPWLVTRDELDPADLRLGCTINDQPIQDGRTSQMRFSVAEVVAFLSRHLTLRPGDLIASGTPARLDTPPGPDRRLQPGDRVKVWIEGIGELENTIA